VQKGIRQLEQDIKYTSDQVTQREEELKKFEHLEKFEIEVEALEETAKQLISKKNALKELELTCGELQNVNDEIESYTHLLSLESLVNYIDDKITLLGEKKVELIKLEKLIDHIQQVKNDISVKERLLQFESQVNQIIWDIDQRDTFELQLGDLGSDTHDLIALEKQIFHYTHTEKALQIQFNKEMGDTCILCGQSIKHKE
jgi:ribosomal protein S15P/S13E